MWTDLQFGEPQELSVKQNLSVFWRHLKNELQFKTLFFFNTQNCQCCLEDILRQDNLSTTIYLWTSQNNKPYLKSQLNLDIFVWVCMLAKDFKNVLEALSRMLNHMREMPILLQIGCYDQAEEEIVEIANLILQRCYELFIPNVLLLLANDFFSTGHLYAYQNYPMFQVNTLLYNTHMNQLYPNKLDNLHGHVIRVEPHFHAPFMIRSVADNGSIIITGMLWRLMNEFAQYHNGTLVTTYNITMSSPGFSHLTSLQNLRNETSDISTFVIPTRLATMENFPFFSYPFLVSTWCIMLPVEGSPCEGIMRVFQSSWMWFYLCLIYGFICWLNGLSWRGRSQISLLYHLMRVALICTVLAQLSAMFIHPQQMKKIKSFEELYLAKILILGWRPEFYMYPEELRIQFASNFISYDNLTEFLQLRRTFNTSYGYTIGEDRWRMYKEMQKYFKRPLFRYSYDLCIRWISPHSLLYHENSLLRHQFDAFILRLRDCGIISWWHGNGFYDMIQAGYATLEDFSTHFQAKPIIWKNWQYVMTLYAYALSVALSMFLFELIVYYVNVCLSLV